ncbi:MAG: 5'-nucleotidase [Candidatus Desulfovibrio kirbyi]|jgi:5'-nucleotidase|uniref:5'-nucleotidase SurE n=1 Tax=Candidatus Desulfovibrio kirbyi TaxID=2696086 RepID=A0A6L2R6F7_9BACT|nr:5'/3'-nucleotidase SurE [Desulfovibrio sp.]GFH63119.1 MAG: 5'-nucleotidase [Candidatus Desulfovibrio kirbyi]
MDVLLTNDDGIRAIGLRTLYAALREAGHTVHVVAPIRQQSGVGHSLTVFEPVRAIDIVEPNFQGTGIYGTPTDCVKLALATLLPKQPDMVISGINAGQNVGPDILYSGTVGAATEAAHEDLPSIAVSHNDHRASEDLLPQARHLVELAERIDWTRLARRRVLNINYPAGQLSKAKGIKVCPQTSAVWKNVYTERFDPRGAPYWWLEGEIPEHTINPGSDKDMLNKGYITITPLCFEFTDHSGMDSLRDMEHMPIDLP